jgi:dethiobiotin synthetase
VARAGLGTINHTLLSLEALSKRSLKPLCVILVDAENQQTSFDMIRENMQAVKAFSKIEVRGVIGKIDNFSDPPSQYIQLVDC